MRDGKQPKGNGRLERESVYMLGPAEWEGQDIEQTRPPPQRVLLLLAQFAFISFLLLAAVDEDLSSCRR